MYINDQSPAEAEKKRWDDMLWLLRRFRSWAEYLPEPQKPKDLIKEADTFLKDQTKGEKA